METKVIPYQSMNSAKKDSYQTNNSTNIWQFLARNEKGATFELPILNFFDDEKAQPATKKYITLN